MSFESFGLSPELMKSIEFLKYKEPTLIQSESIPHIMKGTDVIGESATGSGKTLAFGCAIVEKTTPGAGLQSLVLTPTRELAEQIKDSLRQLSHHKRLSVITIYGGVAIGPQIDVLPRADVVVATPGRLLDVMERRAINLTKVKLLVLDEADRMFDMGFIDDVERIIKSVPKERQSLLFSATMPDQIKRLAHKYMKSPISVAATKQVDPSKLTQLYYDITRNQKLSLLTHLLQNEKSGLVIVFCNTRHTTDFVTKNLQLNKIDAIAIHGGLSQNKRSRTLKMFNKAKATALVCTDLAARGLHIDNVSHVYNYDIPKDSKDYVHRIGRTARAGEEGKAINFVSDQDYDNFSRILRDYRNFKVVKIDKPVINRIIAVRDEERNSRQGGYRQGSRPYARSGSRPFNRSSRDGQSSRSPRSADRPFRKRYLGA